MVDERQGLPEVSIEKLKHLLPGIDGLHASIGGSFKVDKIMTDVGIAIELVHLAVPFQLGFVLVHFSRRRRISADSKGTRFRDPSPMPGRPSAEAAS